MLQLITRYIHLNPVRAGIVQAPEKYPWTGHLSYLGKGRYPLVDSALVLSQLGRSRLQARRRYQQFVLEGVSEVHQEKYYKVKDQRYLGGDEFVEKVESLKRGSEPVFWEIAIEEIAREVIYRMKVPADRLYSMTRDRLGAYGRELVAYLARKLVGLRVKEIAQYFRREPMTVSLGIRKIEELLHRDKDLARRVEAMELNLRKKGKKKYFITIA